MAQAPEPFDVKVKRRLTDMGYRNGEGDIDVRTVLQQLSSCELVSLYKRVWKRSHREFCEMFGIHQGNFSHWVRAHKNSPSSVHAVRQFLLYGEPREALDAVQHLGVVCMSTLLDKINRRQRFGDGNTLKALVFVDADNYIRALDSLRWLAPTDASLRWGIHVVATIRNGHHSSRLFGLEDREWLTLSQSLVSTPEAVNHAISMQMALLHSAVATHVPFIVVTRDAFSNESCSQLVDLGRHAVSIRDASLMFDLMRIITAPMVVYSSAADMFTSVLSSRHSLCVKHATEICKRIVGSVHAMPLPEEFEVGFHRYFVGDDEGDFLAWEAWLDTL
jgi:hypothetical protein